jgi:hypothetical protein
LGRLFLGGGVILFSGWLSRLGVRDNRGRA